MSQAPPSFADFGKSIKDLLTKKFSSNAFEFSTKRNGGVTSDVGATINSKGAVDGNLKLTYKNPSFGEEELDLNVNGKWKAAVKLNKLTPGVTYKAAVNSAALDKPLLAADKVKGSAWKESPFATVGVDAQYKNANLTAALNSNGAGAFVDLSASVGSDGLSTAGYAKLALAKTTADQTPAAVLQDVGLGVQYANPAYTVGMTSVEMWNKLTISQFLNVSKDYKLGSQFEWNIDAGAGLVTIGSETKIDSETLFKAKAAVGASTGASAEPVFTAAAFLERQLSKEVKVGATVNFNALNAKPFTPANFGLSLTVGDF